MTKENAHLYIPLVEALRDGELQVGGPNYFRDAGNDLIFDAPPEYYRRKPKPREIWVNIYEGHAHHQPNGYGYAYTDERAAINLRGEDCSRTVKFIEAI